MAKKILVTDSLTKRFDAIQASDAISIELYPNEIHAIIGPNGAGKSTLLAQICGSLSPDSGTVTFLGKDVTRQKVISRARAGLARTFQISELAMDDSVLQNALLGAVGASAGVWQFFRPVLSDKNLRTRAEAALVRVGLSDYIDERTSTLSHGQRRLLEVAVALTLTPKAFVMDEPMAGLGADGSSQLTELLAELKREAPILLVEHDMDAVFALADRISVLVYGKVIASGSVEDIRANTAVQEAYLGEVS